jgi:hypothetical protein
MKRGPNKIARRPLSKVTEDQLIAGFRQVADGATIRQIAVRLDVNQTGLSRLLQAKFGYKPTPYRRPTLTLPDDPVILAYLAGLIDGEGSIMFLNKHWCVKIGMTDEPVIRWLADFGGLFSIEKRPPPRKTPYYWSVHRRHDVLHLLRALLPYLRVKRAKAQQVLELMVA